MRCFYRRRDRRNGLQGRCRLCCNRHYRTRRHKPSNDGFPGYIDVALAAYWQDDAGTAWIALRDAAAAWPRGGDFTTYAKVCMHRAVQRAQWADQGIRRTREGWRQTEIPFTDLNGEVPCAAR